MRESEIRVNISKLDHLLYRVVASKRFFIVTLVLFGLSALWVATASLYPMAFDEDTHIGIITIYSHYLLPILPSTPDMAKFGGVSSDPSYLFHYLMSFPWRLEQNVFNMSQAASIVGLRLLDIVMYMTGLLVFWRALGKMRISNFSRNVIIAFCSLIPVAPLLAGQVNYDNLVILEVAVSFCLAVNILMSLKDKHELPKLAPWLLILTLLFGSATKYAFLPIALAIVATILATILLSKHRRTIGRHFVDTIFKARITVKLLLVFLIVIGLALNVRYIENVASYHTVSPKCDSIFSADACMAFGPYARKTKHETTLSPSFKPKNILAYIVEDWIPGMNLRLFFSVAGPTNNFDTKQPVAIPILIYSTGIIIAVLVFLIRSVRILKKNSLAWLSLSIVVMYCLSLIYELYEGYRSTGQAIALNGRYLLPLAPIIGALIVMAFQYNALKQKARKYGSTIIITVMLLAVLVGGGGVGTYIVQGRSSWFWGGWGQTSYKVAHSALKPIVIR